MSEETHRRTAFEGLRDSSSAAKDAPSRETPRLYEFGPFRLDPTEHRLLRGNEVVPLTPKAFDTLHLLVRNSGRVLEKDELIGMLWPDTFVEEGSLSNHIFLLRKALGEDPAFIETVPRRGYRFIGAVRQFPVGPAAHLEKPPEMGAFGIASPRAQAWRPWRGRVALGIVAAALLASLAAAGWFYKFVARGEAIDSLAVLPFVNANATPNTEYLSDGITESLINSLSQLPNLKVMSRDSAFRYKGKDTDAKTAGRELGVRAIFKGRVTQRGDTLNISAELINARDGSHIWGQRYDRKLTDIVALQEEIAREMASALRVRLTGAQEKRLTKSYTANSEAYQDYLRGRYFWNKRSEEALNKGVGYFQQAITKDPKYGLAYDGLSDCYILLAVYGFSSPKEALPRAKEAALKSLEIDATLAEAHTSLARIKGEYDWDWSGAEREFQRARELNPSYAIADLWYGDVLATMGRHEESIANYKRALKLDPLSLAANMLLGQAFYFARQYDQAIDQLEKTLELDPNFVAARIFLGFAYLQKSLYKEGIAELEKGSLLSPGNPTVLAHLGYAYAVVGRRAEAEQARDKLNQLSKQKYVIAKAVAGLYVGLGDKGKAFEWLERGYEERSIGLGGVDLKVDPIFDPLRSDPRFAALLQRMNLQP